MNIFSKFYCRVYQITLLAFSPFLPFREPSLIKDYENLVKVLKEHNKTHAFLVTDKGVREHGLTIQLENELKLANINFTVFDGTKSNPTISNVEKALELYKTNNCDTIIALGGGSPMDCAKAVGARVAKPHKSLSDMKGLLKVNHKLPLLIAIPTTAGTGSETTVSAVITNEETNHKYIINDFDLIPNYALLDANLTTSLPKHLTATTGMDALSHAVEAFIGNSTTKTTRKYSLEAIKLIFENLERAYSNGDYLEARENMLKASFLAGKAFTKSYVGYIHAIAHTLGGQYNLSHGFANAVIMPYMLRMFGKSVYKKLHKIGVYVGLFDEKTKKEQGAKIVIKKIEEMNKAMSIPTKIKELQEADIPILAKRASKEANPLYPVPKLFNAKQLQNVYYMIKE